MVTLEKIKNSMLWAAYADALGFISELSNSAGMYTRIGSPHVTGLMPWRRRVGGKYGVEIELPAGTYSDDTQLRLSTCRSIRPDGQFDVETFAKVELPVWLAYGLGGGRGTKAAAENLRKNNVHWHSNFYKSDYSDYMAGGGNGAAMRIQPHVLSAPLHKNNQDILCDVIRNTIVTHGHSRALVGAGFHALVLKKVICESLIPDPKYWVAIADELRSISQIVANDHDLSMYWLPTWEQLAHQTIHAGINKAVDELISDIKIISKNIKKNEPELSYNNAVEQLGCLRKELFGSAPKTALLALYLSYLHAENPERGILNAANLLGSDTDTIATMAGAILGVVAEKAPPQIPLDNDYIVNESERLYKISLAQKASSYAYPDMIYWQPPLTQLDTVGILEGQMVLLGIGNIKELSYPNRSELKSNTLWQWVRLDFGQTLLVKRRVNPKKLDDRFKPVIPKHPMYKKTEVIQLKGKQLPLWDQRDSQKKALSESTIDECTQVCIRSDFKPETIGSMLLKLIDGENAVEKAIAFTAIIAKAKVARDKHGNSKNS